MAQKARHKTWSQLVYSVDVNKVDAIPQILPKTTTTAKQMSFILQLPCRKKSQVQGEMNKTSSVNCSIHVETGHVILTALFRFRAN